MTATKTTTTETQGSVYCALCTHTVEAKITHAPKASFATPGQRCPRCSSSLDAAYVFRMDRAA